MFRALVYVVVLLAVAVKAEARSLQSPASPVAASDASLGALQAEIAAGERVQDASLEPIAATPPSEQDVASGGRRDRGASGQGQPDNLPPGDPPFTLVQPHGARRELHPEVDQSTGALVYRFAFSIPPGRNGMSPSLGLTYNSQATQEENLAGYGWSLDVPYVERLNIRGFDTFYSGGSTDFNSSPWGPLSQIAGNAYGQKTQSGERLSFAYTGGTGGSWTLTTLDGTVHTFGASQAADGGRQADTFALTHVYRWYLESSVDTHGNSVRYLYDHSDGQLYLSSVLYTGTPSNPGPLFLIRFLYTDPRPDIITSNNRGFQVTTRRILREVQVKRNDTGALVTKYVLAHTQDARNNRSLLTSITETGYDDSGAATLRPPTTLAYTTDAFAWNSVFPNDTPEIWGDSHEFGIVFADVDGDAYPDAVKATKWNISPNTIVKETRRNLSYQTIAGGYDYPYLSSPLPTWIPPKVICEVVSGPNGVPTGDAQGVVVTDVTGDVLPDFVFADSTSSQTSQVYVNTGSNWVHDPVWDGQVQPLDPTYTGFRPQLGDVNGDGLMDQIKISGGFVYSADVFKNTGTAFTFMPFGNGLYNGTGIRGLDFDHDGCTDLIQSSDTAGQRLLPNTQGAFQNWGSSFGGFSLPPSNFPLFETQSEGVVQAVFADLNGDQLPEFIDRQGRIWFHSGTGWTLTGQLGGTIDSIVDLNADGLPDVIVNSCSWFPTYCGTWIHYGAGKVPDLLKSITLPTGGTVDIAYKSSARYLNGNVLANPKLPFVVMTVERTTATDHVTGLMGNTTYHYQGGAYHFVGTFDRRFAGFETVTANHPDGSQTVTYSHQGNGVNAALSEPVDHASLIGRVYRTDIIKGGLIRRSMAEWGFTPLTSVANDRYAVRPSRTTAEEFDGNSTRRNRGKTFSYDSNLGWLSSETDFGEVTVTTPPYFTDITADTVIQRDFGHTSGGVGLVLPTYDEVRENGLLVSKRVRSYDTPPTSQPTIGDLTQLDEWIVLDGSVKAVTIYTHDGHGNVLTEVDSNLHSTTYVYDAFKLYPGSVTNAKNQTTTYSYDYSSGDVRQTIDANGDQRTTDFDGLDRIVVERVPDPLTGALVTARTLSYIDSANPHSITETTFLSPALGVDVVSYLDGFGRTIQVRTRAEDQASVPTYAVTDTAYDTKGRVARTSLPYFSSGSALTPPTSLQALHTTFSYDGLDRIVGHTNVVGTTTWAYDEWETTVTDALGRTKVLERDARDRLVRVDENVSGVTFVTRYTWNALGRLLTLTDALGNLRRFTYDGLGRRLSAEDLHAPSDPTFGSYTFVYDAVGNLISKATPNGDVILYTYDELNRPLTEDFLGSPGIDVSYTYDTCVGGIGRLCSATNPVSSIGREYDHQGNVSRESKTIGGAPYQSVYARDFQGNKVSITNPDGSATSYQQNIAGRVDTVAFQEAGAPSPVQVVLDISYGPAGEPALEVYANGTSAVWIYDQAELYRLREHRLDTASGPYSTISYTTYDAVGNVISIADADLIGITTKSFGYDHLDRLVSATAVGPSPAVSYSESYAYDALGSMLAGPAGTYTYEGHLSNSFANPHAATSIEGIQVYHDRNGNVLRSGGLVNAWNYRNELVATALATADTVLHPPSSPLVNYSYDAEGSRVRLSTNTSTTDYPSDTYNTDGVRRTRHIFIDRGPVVIVEATSGGGSTTFWNYTDHLGSTRIVTDATGAIVESLDYTPFGSQIPITLVGYAEQRKFTGHEFDKATQYTYAQARYVDSRIARFTSQDPASTDIPAQFQADPQQLNTYAYARNNPLMFVDREGTKVELAARPAFTRWGLHQFYLVTPNNPAEIDIAGLPSGTEQFTIGAYNRGVLWRRLTGIGNELVPEIGYVGGPDNSDRVFLTGEKRVATSTPITPSNGQSDSDFINSLGSEFSDIGRVSYFWLGQRGKLGYANSNNFVYELGARAGVGSQVAAFDARGYAPGRNRGLPEASLIQYLQQRIDSLREQVRTLQAQW